MAWKKAGKKVRLCDETWTSHAMDCRSSSDEVQLEEVTSYLILSLRPTHIFIVKSTRETGDIYYGMWKNNKMNINWTKFKKQKRWEKWNKTKAPKLIGEKGGGAFFIRRLYTKLGFYLSFSSKESMINRFFFSFSECFEAVHIWKFFAADVTAPGLSILPNLHGPMSSKNFVGFIFISTCNFCKYFLETKR